MTTDNYTDGCVCVTASSAADAARKIAAVYAAARADQTKARAEIADWLDQPETDRALRALVSGH